MRCFNFSDSAAKPVHSILKFDMRHGYGDGHGDVLSARAPVKPLNHKRH